MFLPRFLPRYRPACLNLFQGYRREWLGPDLLSGISLGVIALPLAIGFGIASGAQPAQGLWTAVIAGLVVALLGGSRFQIAGPTGAFTPVLAGVVASHGYHGLVVATLLAGALLVAMGLSGLGALLRYIPYPVVAGFTTGIAVIIFLGQIPDLLGLNFARHGGAPELLASIATHLNQFEWHTAVVGLASVALGLVLPRFWPRLPAAMIVVVCSSVAVALTHWPVATIGSRFGGLPMGLPELRFPEMSLADIRALAGPAMVMAALGGIESLLSATVADGLTDTRHDANSELIGQGLANLLVPLAGGFAATGAIARTAANIRYGGRSPLAGIVHALVLMVFALCAAPLAAHIPLAGLAAILVTVAVRMAEWDTFPEMWRGSRSDFATLCTTFLLTVVFDLTVGVAVGLAIAAVLFVKRMEQISNIRVLTAENETEYDGSMSVRGKEVPDGVVMFRLEGPLFFAAVEKLEAALRSHTGRPRVVIFRLRHVPAIDASALHSLEVALAKMHRDGVLVLFTAVQPQPMKVLFESGMVDRIGLDNFCANIDEALALARRHVDHAAGPAPHAP